MHPILFVIPLPHWKLPAWIAARFGAEYLPPAFPIYAYGVMLGLSLVVGWYISLGLAKRDGLPREAMANNYVVTAIAAIVGARLLYIVTNLDEFKTWKDYLSIRSGGLVAYGGFLGGFVGSWWYCTTRKVRLLAWADVAVPSLASGLMLTRLGCYMFGCDFGKRLPETTPAFLKKLGTFPEWHYDASTAKWLTPQELSAAYANGAHPTILSGSPAWVQHTSIDATVRDLHHSLPVHPTQLYESLVGLTMLLAIFWARRSIQARRQAGKPFFRGEIFLLFTFGYGALRFLLEIVRDDAERGVYGPYFEPQNGYPVALMVLALAFWFGLSHIISEKFQTIARVIAVLVPGAVFFALKPANHFDLVEKVQLSTSQWIALLTGAMAAVYYRRGLDLAIADPEVAADLGEGVPALLEEEAAYERGDDPGAKRDEPVKDDAAAADEETKASPRARADKPTVREIPAVKVDAKDALSKADSSKADEAKDDAAKGDVPEGSA
ncbi:MAG: prolipoprotein diacylglyceryl transferase family protein [Polyangiales bacterium]